MTLFLFQMLLPTFVLILSLCHSDALMGYNCEVPYNNGTLISLVEHGSCHSPGETHSLQDIYVELLQQPETITVNVLSCRIEIESTMQKEHSETKLRFRNRRYYLLINSSICIHMHVYKELRLEKLTFDNLKMDVTNSRLLPLTVNDQLTSPVNIHIVIKNHYIKVNLLDNKIYMPTGTSCTYTDLECDDEEGYQNYWSPSFEEGCKPLSHFLVYRGYAKRIQSNYKNTIEHNSLDAYVITHGNKRIFLFVRTRHEICNTTIMQIEHPQLLIREVDKTYLQKENFVNKTYLSIYSNPSLYNYVTEDTNLNSKNIYIMINIERCLKRKVELLTAINTHHGNLPLMAYTLTGAPGYSARLRGEALHLFRCTPVPAHLRHAGDCFQELPVTIDGKPMYLQPKTRIITDRGTQITCNHNTAAMYHINNQWYMLLPEVEQAEITPKILPNKLLPWGHSIDTCTDHCIEQPATTDDSIVQRSEALNGEYLCNSIRFPAIITIITVTIILLVIVASKLCKNHHIPELPTHSQPTVIWSQPGYSHDNDDDDDRSDTPRSTSLHSIRRVELLRRPLHTSTPKDATSQEKHISAQLATLRQTYQQLEQRINAIHAKQ